MRNLLRKRSFKCYRNSLHTSSAPTDKSSNNNPFWREVTFNVRMKLRKNFFSSHKWNREIFFDVFEQRISFNGEGMETNRPWVERV